MYDSLQASLAVYHQATVYKAIAYDFFEKKKPNLQQKLSNVVVHRNWELDEVRGVCYD